MEPQFHHSLSQRIMWTLIVRVLARIIIFFRTRWRVKGRENVPRDGPLLIVSNHLTYADQFLISSSLNRKVVFMAKEELFHSRLIRYLARPFGAFPVRRGGIIDREAWQQANQILDSGQALVMFPEGTRSKDAQLQPAYPGSALIAAHNHVPILPIGMTGLEHSNKGWVWGVLHRPKVTVNIGRPFYLPPVSGQLTKAELTKLADYIMEHIAELLPPEYQGHYARRRD
jgi:1-acyl-sn-glycerol-3-phosphate acyltransferase